MLVLSASLLSLQAQDGYEIRVEMEAFPTDTCHLAFHLGDMQYYKDTAAVKDGAVVFKGEETLPGGIYLVVFPPKNNYFEILLDKDQHFTLKTDSADFVGNMQVTGSEDNKLFFQDLKFIAQQRKKATELQEKAQNVEEGSPESKQMKEEMNAIDKEVKTARAKLIEANPEMLYAKILKAMKEPEVPEAPVNENGEKDQNFAFRYYRSHFFDNIDLTDERLMYTPIMYNKVKQYLERLTPRHPDSINVAIDYIVDKSRPNKEVFKFLVVKLLNKYVESKIMGMDGVYVHMVEEYYMSGDAFWTDEEQVKKMEERALAIAPTLIGRPAPNFRVQDINEKWYNLYDIPNEYTILYFWDYDCGHCKKVTPALAEKYKSELADKGVALFTVSINGDVEEWKKSVEEYGLTGVVTQDHKRQSRFDQMYDVRSTPRIFILDKEKKIIAKQLEVEQISEVLDHHMGVDGEDLENMEEKKEGKSRGWDGH